MKKILAFLLAIIMVLGSVPALAEDAVVDSSQPVSVPNQAILRSAAPGDFGGLIVDNYIKDDPTKYDSDTGIYTTEDGGTFTYADNVLTVLDGTVSLSGSTTDKVEVAGNNPNLLLNGVDITAAKGPAVKILSTAIATITLKEGKSNTLNAGGGNYAGIEVEWNSGSDFADLTIDGAGTLNAKGAGSGAGIGGSKSHNGVYGNITINNGTINATGAGRSAGIGSSDNPNDGASHGSYKHTDQGWGTITINGGNITAIGEGNGAGIGGGNHTDSGLIIINDGVIDARGDSGIGSGLGSSKGDDKGPGYYCAYVTINGGQITAHATDNMGAGIGGGMYSDGIVTITGGNIIATVDTGGNTYQGGAGIGGGYQGLGKVTITGGTVNATGGHGGAGIGNGALGATTTTSAYSNGQWSGTKSVRAGIPTLSGSEAVVNISGGAVTATGGEFAAGIGSGNACEWANVIISGGTVYAYGAKSSESDMYGGAGIGSGVTYAPSKIAYKKETDVNVTITGGDVLAVGGWGAAGIGSGANNKIADSISISDSSLDNLVAFADGTKFAIDTRQVDGDTTHSYTNGRNISTYVLQGTFVKNYTYEGVAQSPEGLQGIRVINDLDGQTKEVNGMPSGYRSFATDVSGAGTYTVYTDNSSIGQGQGRYFSETKQEVFNESEILNNGVLFQVTGSSLSDNFYLYPVKTIVVQKKVETEGSLAKEGINMKVSFALQKHSNKDTDIYEDRQTIEIKNGRPQGKVYFVNVADGVYDILEMNGSKKMEQGTIFDTIVLKKITTADSNDGSTNNGEITPNQWTDRITVTNTFEKYTPQMDVSGEKTWNDVDNQDGIRPTEITVRLVANGAPTNLTATVTPDENGAWKYTFKNVPINDDNGDPYTYTVTENKVEGYTPTYDGMNIENAHIPETVPISGEKTWDDANNQDGKRPASISITLYANGVEKEKKTVTAADGWKWDFGQLPKFAQGKEIQYTITEEPVTDYTAEISGYDVINTHEPELIDLTVKKVWDDANNQDGKRPASLTVTLSNGTEVTLNAANNWSATVKNLPKYANGAEIQYTWTEKTLPEGYTLTNTSVNGTVTTLTNKYTPETTEATVTKVWNDADNQDGKRPASLTVTLSNGTEVTLNAANNWTATVKNLPKYADGKEIEYTWTEADIDGYTLTNTDTNGTVTTLTNSHTPETTEATVTKVWDDANNQDGKRPASLTVTLSNGETVTLNAANNWSATVKNLPKYADGKEIQYTWTEETLPDGYTLTNTSVNGTVTTLTNSHTPETTEATVAKVWNDADNQDGKRPASLTVTLSNGDKVTLNAANNWTAKIENLPKYANGEEIKYTWTEEALPAGYTLTDTSVNGTVTTLTNKYTPETTEASVKKVWNDADNQDGKRPASITVTLSNGTEVTLNAANNWTATVKNLPKYANGEEIKYTWTEADIDGYELTNTATSGTVTTLTNTHTPETTEASVTKVWNDADNQDGKRPASLTVTLSNGETVTLNAANNWSATVKNLPKYADGKEIQYTWTEETLPEGYTLTNTSVNGTITTLTNSHTPETTEATVVKVWDDADNQDGKRPASLTVTLSNGDKVTLNAANSWTATVKNLPKYANGEEINYTWTEEALPEGYTLTNTSVNGTVTTLTNSHTPETTEATVVKVWNDANDQDKIRPVRLTVSLRNGVSVTLSAANNWTAKVENLPKYDQGREISYTWREETIEGYTLTNTAVNGTITTLTNTHTPEPEPETVPTISVDGVKVWNDRNDQDGLRPASVTIRLLANGEPVDSRVVTAEDNWAFSFRELPQFRDGVAIVYTITEDEVPGYTTAIAGYIVTNTHETATRTINGAKTWNDDNDRDGLRPASITVNLLADGAVVRSTAVTAANGWAWSFENVDRYREGREIVYTVTENAVPGYTAEVLGYSIRNTHEPERVSVNGVKVWNDENNMDGLRPASVTVNLLANGTQVASRAVTGTGDTWNYTFDNLPRNENGQPIVYTVTEDPVPGYTAQIAGTTITNTHEPARITVSGVKTWADQEDADGLRPASIVVNLLADGRRVDSQTVTGSGSTWRYTFADLPQYVNGREIVYTVSETAPEGYTAQISGTDITNTHVPSRVDVRGTKSWADHDDADGLRPTSITLRLLADGQETDRQTVTGSGTEWAYAFTGLPEYKDGRKITYTVTEDAVPEYETVITGYNVFNIHHPSEEIPGEELYKLTVRYWADGKTAFPDFTATYHFGDRYDVVSPIKQGYTVDLPEVVGVIYQDTVVDVYYTPNPVHLTVFYQYLDGTTAADTHYETLMPGDDYNVPSPVLPGYTASMAVVAGTMPGRDVEFVVVYVPVIVPGQPVPEDDPDQPVQLYEFDDLNTPLGLGNVELNAGDCFE